MTAQEFQALLIEGGIDQDTVARLTGNAGITAKLGQLKQATEYQAIQQRADALLAEKQQLENAKAALEADLNGDGTAAKPGTRAYAKWYQDNYATITANANKLRELEASRTELEDSVKQYETKYGKITAAAAVPVIPTSIPGMTKEEVKAIAEEIAGSVSKTNVAEAYKTQYAPQVVSTMTGIGTILERHLKRKRDHDIDWKKLDELAAKPEIAGDVIKAYEEWDAPNVLADQKAAEVAKQASEDKRVEDRVNELLKKRMLQTNFPAGAEGASSSTGSGVPSPLSRDGLGGATKTYDRSKLLDAFQSVQ